MLTFGAAAFDLLVNGYEFENVVDIGCGDGSAAAQFAMLGKATLTIDEDASHDPDIIGSFPLDPPTHPISVFDCVWACHVLEHQANPGHFLSAALECLKPGGILAVVVPPYQGATVVGHLSMWDAGTLVYAMATAGADCRETVPLLDGYNLSAIARKPDPPREALFTGTHFKNLLLPDWFKEPRFSWEAQCE